MEVAMKFSNLAPVIAFVSLNSAACSSSEEEMQPGSDLVYPSEAKAEIARIFATADLGKVSARDALKTAAQAGGTIEYRDIEFVRCSADADEIAMSGRILFGASSERGPFTIKFAVTYQDNFVCLEFFEPKQ